MTTSLLGSLTVLQVGLTSLGVPVSTRNGLRRSRAFCFRVDGYVLSLNRCHGLLTVRQYATVSTEELTEWELISKSPLYIILRDRPIRRQLEYDPTKQINLHTDQRYQFTAEDYIRGIINSTPCNHYLRGVEPFSRGLPVYPDYVSIPVDVNADMSRPGTRWLIRGICMNCHYRSYTDCSCRTFLF
jgi:hypothetical protein